MAVFVQHMKNCSLILAKGIINTEDCNLMEQVMRSAALSRNKTVWVDCEAVTSIPTGSLRMLLSLTSKADASGVLLLFFQFNAKISKTIEKAGLNSAMNILPTMADAYSYCRQKAIPAIHPVARGRADSPAQP